MTTQFSIVCSYSQCPSFFRGFSYGMNVHYIPLIYVGVFTYPYAILSDSV